jgi:LysM repeat protein
MKIKLCDSFYYRVKTGDTIQGLCQRFNAETNNIIRNNNNIDLYAGEWVFIKQNDYIQHIVKPCETIVEISNHYKISVDDIKTKNKLSSNKLFIGQKLKIYK